MVVLERSDAAERKRSDIPSEFGLVRLGTLVDLHVGFSGRSGRNKNVSCQQCRRIPGCSISCIGHPQFAVPEFVQPKISVKT